jgi:RNA polymerase sigma factor (sigma-70 family)
MSETRIDSSELAEVAETRQQLFDRLMRPHLRRLYRFAFHLTRSAGDAEDLLQDVLLKLFGRVDELSSIADLAPWASRVLFNHHVDLRRRSRQRRLFVVPWTARERGAEMPGPEEIPAPAPGPDCDAALALDIERLQRALAQLSEEHRIVVLLHDAEGCKLEEIAAMTGVPTGTVKSRLHRARERLRALTDDGTFSG